MKVTEATPSNVGEWRWWTAGYGVRVVFAMILACAASVPLVIAINDLILVTEGSGPTAPDADGFLLFFVLLCVIGGAPSAAAVLLFSTPGRKRILGCLLFGPVLIGALTVLLVALWTPGLLGATLDPARLTAWFARPIAITATVATVFVGTGTVFGVLPRRGSTVPARL